MEVGGGGPYRVRQSMSSHVEHRSYDFADHSMLCLSSPALLNGSFVGDVRKPFLTLDIVKVCNCCFSDCALYNGKRKTLAFLMEYGNVNELGL